jgi:hypothetical protein
MKGCGYGYCCYRVVTQITCKSSPPSINNQLPDRHTLAGPTGSLDTHRKEGIPRSNISCKVIDAF